MEPESLCCICQPRTLRHYRLPAQKCGGLFALQTKVRNISRLQKRQADNDKGQETDIGIPLGSENGLTKLEIFGFRGLTPVLCPVTIDPKGKKYVNTPYFRTRQGLNINTIIKKSGTHVTRIMQMLFSDLHDSRHMYFVCS